MDTQSKGELERLYTSLNSATASTHFYNEVYEYMSFIHKNAFISTLLEKDNEEWHRYDVKKLDTRPKQRNGESDTSFFLKKMNHMDSGDRQFLSYYFLIINRDIFYLIDWFRKDSFYSDECDIMLNGRMKKSLLERLFPKSELFPKPNTDFNALYIDDMHLWKNFISEFHSLLLKKIANTSTPVETDPEPQSELAKEIVLEVSPSGHFRYFGTEGVLNPKRREYLLLHRLASKKNKTVTYKEITKHIYKKEGGFPLNMEIHDLVRKLKNRLEKSPSGDLPSLVKNHKRFGYYLDLQPNQDVIISP